MKFKNHAMTKCVKKLHRFIDSRHQVTISAIYPYTEHGAFRRFHQIYRKSLSYWAISIIFLFLMFFLDRITLAKDVNKKQKSDLIIQNQEESLNSLLDFAIIDAALTTG